METFMQIYIPQMFTPTSITHHDLQNKTNIFINFSERILL